MNPDAAGRDDTRPDDTPSDPTRPDDTRPDIAELERQHRELQLPSAGLADTWRLGSLIVAVALERGLAVTVDRPNRTVRHATPPPSRARRGAGAGQSSGLTDR
ncbi:hypothetical protein ACWEO1_40530, partial [Kitasatospora cineracea]